MKFLLFFILSLLLVLVINSFAPFWIVMITLGLLAILIHPGGLSSFFGGGFAMAGAWMGLAFYLNFATGSELATKIAALFGVDSGVIILLITGTLGFVLGSFSALSGQLFWQLLRRRPDNIYRGEA